MFGSRLWGAYERLCVGKGLGTRVELQVCLAVLFWMLKQEGRLQRSCSHYQCCQTQGTAGMLKVSVLHKLTRLHAYTHDSWDSRTSNTKFKFDVQFCPTSTEVLQQIMWKHCNEHAKPLEISTFSEENVNHIWCYVMVSQWLPENCYMVSKVFWVVIVHYYRMWLQSPVSWKCV